MIETEQLNKEVEINDILYFNENDKTACVNDFSSPLFDVFIPRSIKHDENEYNIISISDFSFYESTEIRSIQFSQLKKILFHFHQLNPSQFQYM